MADNNKCLTDNHSFQTTVAGWTLSILFDQQIISRHTHHLKSPRMEIGRGCIFPMRSLWYFAKQVSMHQPSRDPLCLLDRFLLAHIQVDTFKTSWASFHSEFNSINIETNLPAMSINLSCEITLFFRYWSDVCVERLMESIQSVFNQSSYFTFCTSTWYTSHARQNQARELRERPNTHLYIRLLI